MWRFVEFIAVISIGAMVISPSVAQQPPIAPPPAAGGTPIINGPSSVTAERLPEAQNQLGISPGGYRMLHFVRPIGSVYIYNSSSFPDLISQTSETKTEQLIVLHASAEIAPPVYRSGVGCIDRCGIPRSRVIILDDRGERLYDAYVYVGRPVSVSSGWVGDYYVCSPNGCHVLGPPPAQVEADEPLVSHHEQEVHKFGGPRSELAPKQ